MVIVDTDALFQCLIEDLTLDKSEDPVTVFAKDSLKKSFLKKFRKNTSKDADAKAIAKFLTSNSRCKEWVPRRNDLFIDELVGHFKEEVHKFFNPQNRYPLFSTDSELLAQARVGPGAAIGARGNDFYTKMFSSDLCTTSRFFEVSYTNYCSRNPTWADAEKLRSQAGFTFKVVSSSRLSCVPKYDDISRVICIEPGLNMFYQLGLGAILTRRLSSHFGIHIESYDDPDDDMSAFSRQLAKFHGVHIEKYAGGVTQPDVNRELARLGSLNGRHFTVDLESASDSISLRMLEATFPKDVVRWLRLLRSPSVTLPTGEVVELHMVSSMGNGFTFPLQTIIFSCAISAVRTFLRLPREKAGKTWSVFGDDIIGTQEIAAPLLSLLDWLGFTVNQQKSFFEGPFRESCGRDFFNGHDVRGVYLRTLETRQDLCVAINLLNRWSARVGVFLPKTVTFLAKKYKLPFVPPRENDDAGVMVPFSFVDRPKRSMRYQSYKYRKYVAQPRVLRVGDGVITGPRGARKRIFNPSGLWMAFLNGTLVNGEIGIRHDVTLYRSATGISPYWDYLPTTPAFAGVSLQRWKNAVRSNLID